MAQRTVSDLASLVSESRHGSRRASRLAFLQEHIRPKRGQRWTLEGHAYMRDIVLDPAEIVAAKKAAQVGMTLAMLGEMFATCIEGYDAGYFLDTAGRMERFVQTRIDPIINNDPFLVSQVAEVPMEMESGPKRRGGRPADNVKAKIFGGRGTMYFLDTQVMGNVKSIPLDMLVMDEVAELDEEKAEYALDRLLHSDLKRQRWFSQPAIPEMDIDDWFNRGDQKYWKMRCPRCRTWWALEDAFPECLFQVRNEWRIGCPKCHVKLDPEQGQWVAAKPGADISSYTISQLYGPKVDAAYIAKAWERAQSRPSRMARFMNSILGKAFAGDRQPITDVLFNERCGDWGIAPTGRGAGLPLGMPFAGIDVGDMIHLMIARFAGDMGRVVWIEETGDWDLVEKRLRDHQVYGFVIDAKPEKTQAKNFCRRLGNGAIIYTGGERTHYGIDDEKSKAGPVPAIHTNRDDMMDAVVDAMVAGELWFPKPSLPETEMARKHLKKFIRERRDDGTYSYRQKVENHLGMCAAHMLAGIQGERALGLAPPAHLGPADSHLIGRPLVTTGDL